MAEIEHVIEYVRNHEMLPKLLAAIVIFIVGRWITNLVTKMIDRLMVRSNIEGTLPRFLVRTANIAMTILVALIAVEQVGIDTTSLLAVIGAAGLAIGLALQGSLANFAAGILLVVLKPFKLGDMIRVGNLDATVDEISIFTTVLRCDDNLYHVLPNSKLMGDLVTNLYRNDTRRLEFIVQVDRRADLDRVLAIIEEVCAANPLVLEDPEPFVGIRSIEDGCINVMTWAWIVRPSFRMVRFRLYKEIKEGLERRGIELAPPQRGVALDPPSQSDQSVAAE